MLPDNHNHYGNELIARINLPSAAVDNAGRQYTIINNPDGESGAFDIFLISPGDLFIRTYDDGTTETIYQNSTYIVYPTHVVTILSSGVEWILIDIMEDGL